MKNGRIKLLMSLFIDWLIEIKKKNNVNIYIEFLILIYFLICSMKRYIRFHRSVMVIIISGRRQNATVRQVSKFVFGKQYCSTRQNYPSRVLDRVRNDKQGRNNLIKIARAAPQLSMRNRVAYWDILTIDG